MSDREDADFVLGDSVDDSVVTKDQFAEVSLSDLGNDPTGVGEARQFFNRGEEPVQPSVSSYWVVVCDVVRSLADSLDREW